MVWQTKADTELPQSASPTTAVGQKALFHGTPFLIRCQVIFIRIFCCKKLGMDTHQTDCNSYPLVPQIPPAGDDEYGWLVVEVPSDDQVWPLTIFLHLCFFLFTLPIENMR